MLRAVQTQWFELIVLRQDMAAAMDCVARSGVAQLEAREPDVGALRKEQTELARAQTRFDEIRERYGGYWPAASPQPLPDDAEISASYSAAVDYLAAWAEHAAGVVEELKRVRTEIDELNILGDLFAAAEHRVPHLGGFDAVGPHLGSLVAIAPTETEPPEIPADLPVEVLSGLRNDYLLAIGPTRRVARFAEQAFAAGWQEMHLPDWLSMMTGTPADAVEARLAVQLDKRHDLEQRLSDLEDRYGLPEALGTIERIQWLIGCAREVDESTRLVRITGWVLEHEAPHFERGLAECGVFHVLAFPVPPEGAKPPVVLFNPAWARRFEALIRMIGLPSSGEADPTVIVALVAPLLFGFMFGDVGQGFVLLVTGLLLYRRFPLLGILIPGGAMAMVFGLLFGSIFGREDIIPPLWLHPLDQPILLLGISVAGGALILLTGLSLQAVQMRWQGRWRDWLIRDAGLLSCYLGLLSIAVIGWNGLVPGALGLLWFIGGAAVSEGLGAGIRALGEMIETMLQLLVNTVSFARAGAFALAHAGLSVAIVGLADASGPLFYWPVLALGNVFVLALEGLVVSIQTTRLLLFEFFIRFLTGGGREFRPLVPPGRPHAYAKEAT